MAWDQLNCHLSLGTNSTPSWVTAAKDQRLVWRQCMTYIYQQMQTQILQVTVHSGAPILLSSRTTAHVLHRCWEIYSYRLRGVCTQHVTTNVKRDYSCKKKILLLQLLYKDLPFADQSELTCTTLSGKPTLNLKKKNWPMWSGGGGCGETGIGSINRNSILI